MLACKSFSVWGPRARWFCYIYAEGEQIWLIKLGREANKVWKTQRGLKVVKAIKQQIPWDLPKSSYWAKIDHPVFVKERIVYKTFSRTLWKLHVYRKCINSPLGKLFSQKLGMKVIIFVQRQCTVIMYQVLFSLFSNWWFVAKIKQWTDVRDFFTMACKFYIASLDRLHQDA